MYVSLKLNLVMTLEIIFKLLHADILNEILKNFYTSDFVVQFLLRHSVLQNRSAFILTMVFEIKHMKV